MFVSGLFCVAGYAVAKKVSSALGEMNIFFYGIVIEGGRQIAWGYIKYKLKQTTYSAHIHMGCVSEKVLPLWQP